MFEVELKISFKSLHAADFAFAKSAHVLRLLIAYQMIVWEQKLHLEKPMPEIERNP